MRLQRGEGVRLTKARVKIALLKIACLRKLLAALVQLKAHVTCLMAEAAQLAQQTGYQANQSDAWSHWAHRAADWQAACCSGHASLWPGAEARNTANSNEISRMRPRFDGKDCNLDSSEHLDFAM